MNKLIFTIAGVGLTTLSLATTSFAEGKKIKLVPNEGILTPSQAKVEATLSASAVTNIGKCMNPVEVDLDGTTKMRFCEIPAANGVLIGSENGESDEKPVKARDFQSFQMGQFTVTQAQYRAVIGEEPWKEENGKLKEYVKEGDDYPAVYVSYIQAKQFARIMNLLDPLANYRLPTEAEFEYAARAGTITNYYWGDDFDPSYAYSSENTGSGQYARNVKSCPLPALDAKYPGYCANDFGLMHMSGNVWQWIADAYVNSYANAPTNGNVAVAGDAGSYRVVRGGSWYNGASGLRSGSRNSWWPGNRSSVVGFRLVRTSP